ncbi:MAG: hypothetical protein ACRYG8_03430 [Janthinobacterium lividum]
MKTEIALGLLFCALSVGFARPADASAVMEGRIQIESSMSLTPGLQAFCGIENRGGTAYISFDTEVRKQPAVCSAICRFVETDGTEFELTGENLVVPPGEIFKQHVHAQIIGPRVRKADIMFAKTTNNNTAVCH